MHLADTFIQSSLHSTQDTHLILKFTLNKSNCQRINKKYMYLIIKCLSRMQYNAY